MRLGAPIFDYQTPETWIMKLKEKDYRAAYSPLGIESPLEDFKPYIELANKNDIMISELGIWNNPLDPDPAKRAASVEKCKKSLFYADEIGANCVVNISGSRSTIWDGPDPKNLTIETFEMIVAVVQDIIDSVNPKRTNYTLETMPWMYPNSIESYQDLIKAINRKAFSVHFDPVNLIVSPEKYFKNGELITEFVKELGPYIKSVHLKDIQLAPEFMVHLDEVPPGNGNLNYNVLFKELSSLNKDLPVMLEHLTSEREYDDAGDFVQKLWKKTV